MKYYSEKLDRLFDSEEELKVAENPPKKTKKTSSEDSNKPTAEENVPTKKQLAAEVEAADVAVKEAYANYESAKVKVEELSKKYLDEINAILDPAKKSVKDAEQRRYDAIKNFNNSFGAYQVTYNGARAAEEFVKALSDMDAKSSAILRDLFWF